MGPFGGLTKDPAAVEREGQNRTYENNRNNRPPGRTAHLLDEKPDEELVCEESKRCSDEKPDRPNMGSVARTMPAETEFAVQHISNGAGDDEDEQQ